MSSSPENHISHPQNQTTPQTRHTARSRFPLAYTPPPLQFMQTPEAGGSTQPEGTLMTHDQYVDLKNEYRVMREELRRYNEHRASQQKPTAPKQYPLRQNPELEQSDSQKAQASFESWKPQYSSTERSNGASESSSTKSRRRKSQTD